MNKTKLLISLRLNRAVRFFALPFFRWERKRQVSAYQRSEDAQYIKGLKDIYKGESCFVIGNGPSLRPEDLDALSDAGIVCFGVNRIYNIFPRTKWRPTYYLCLDTPVVLSELDNIASIGDYQKIINYYAISKKKELPENIHFLCTDSEFVVDPYKLTFETLSDDLSKYGTKTGTVTVNAIELAIYMGFQTVYLLGVDHRYALQYLPDGKLYKDPSAGASYFAGMKDSQALGQSIQYVGPADHSYEVCKRFADKKGVKIYNATRDSKLEVFERVDFEHALADIGISH